MLPIAIAGIWDTRKDNTGIEQQSFSMLTVNTDYEKRSGVIVEPTDYAGWLKAEDAEEARAYLKLFDTTDYTAEAAPRQVIKQAVEKK